jgi:hypothetical protein
MPWMRRLFVLLLLTSSFAVAQTAPSSPAASNTAAPAPNPAADAAADTAVRTWLAGGFNRDSAQPNPNAADPNAELLRQVRGAIAQFRYFPPPEGTRVSFDLRRVETGEANERIYTYPITSQITGDSQIRVTMALQNGAWRADRIGLGEPGSAIPDWVSEPWAGWLFAALSAALLYACIAPTFWRRALERSVQSVRQHAGIFIGTNLLLYGIYVIGTLIGIANPAIVRALGEFFTQVLSSSGVAQLTQGTVASAAFGIFLNNLRAGIMIATFIPGSLFAVPAFVISSLQFLIYGVALAPVGTLPIQAWLLHVPTILIELQAYIFVVASSGVMLSRIVKRTPFSVAWREYAACLPLAISILALGAWYEAFEIIVLIPAVLR